MTSLLTNADTDAFIIDAIPQNFYAGMLGSVEV
jgi:hypothetical protein